MVIRTRRGIRRGSRIRVRQCRPDGGNNEKRSPVLGPASGVSFDCDYLRGYFKNAPARQHATTGVATADEKAQVRLIMRSMLPNAVFAVK